MVLAIILSVIIIILIISIVVGKKSGTYETPWKRAGRKGENLAGQLITSQLRPKDRLFRNVKISYEGKPAEMDYIIVNNYGVFIIEVKNYKGRLYGSESDYEWRKLKTDDWGNDFQKTVKNPIPQVKRQVYILAKYLQSYGVDVWVEGYAILIENNSPIRSPYILSNSRDINRAIHTSNKNRLTSRTQARIVSILSSM